MGTDCSVYAVAPFATYLPKSLLFNSTPPEFTISNPIGVLFITTFLGLAQCEGSVTRARSDPFPSVFISG
jgi:hypothetical protein